MKKISLYLFFLILIGFLNGCDSNFFTKNNICDETNQSNCSKQCQEDSDCISSCPMGCINKNQEYQNSSQAECEPSSCHCLNNICSNKQ